MISQARNEHWHFLVDLLDTGEIDCAEFRLQASDDCYANAKIDEAVKAREDVLTTARAIAEKGFGRPWEDFEEVNAHDTDQQDLIRFAKAAITVRAPGAETRKSHQRVESLIAAKRLIIEAAVGSCTCNTKSPELVWHVPNCRYVTLMYALEQVEQAEGTALCSNQHSPKENNRG